MGSLAGRGGSGSALLSQLSPGSLLVHAVHLLGESYQQHKLKKIIIIQGCFLKRDYLEKGIKKYNEALLDAPGLRGDYYREQCTINQPAA